MSKQAVAKRSERSLVLKNLVTGDSDSGANSDRKFSYPKATRTQFEGRPMYRKGLTQLEKDAVKYARGSMKFKAGDVKFKGLRKTLQDTQDQIIDAAMKSAAAEVLLPAEQGSIQLTSLVEKTHRLKQRDIAQEVDLNVSRMMMDLQLTKFGPYNVNYSRNGR